MSLNRTSIALLALALPATAVAKDRPPPPAAPKTIMVFVGADDKGAESSALRLGGMVEEALGRQSRYNFTSLKEAAGERVPAEARASLAHAEDDLAAGKKSFADGKLDDAENNLKAAVKEFEGGAAGLEKMDEYCDANAYLGAVFQLKHHEDDAKDQLQEVLAVDPNYRLDAKLSAGPVADLLRVVRHEVGEGRKGSASLFSVPAGSRVFIDGEVRGYTPMSIDHLSVGKHLFRFERPGYMNFGRTTEIVSTDDTAIKANFQPTKDFSDVEDQIGQALKEVDSSSCGPATFRIMKHYNLDRAIFANVRTTGDNLVLDLALVDLSAKRRVAHRKNSMEGEDQSNVSREVGKLVQNLLADGDTSKQEVKAGKDPLDNVSGMEDWGDDDKGSSDDGRKKKKGDDD